MNMKVTENDKKMLSYLVAFILANIFIFFVLRPITNKNSELEIQIHEAGKQEASMNMSASLAEDMSAMEQSVKEKMTNVLRRFYPVLQSQEVENMVTVLMLNHDMQIQNLTVNMPEKTSNLKWYQYSENAGTEMPTEESNEEGTDSLPEETFGVYAARVVCTAEGDQKDIAALIDDISGNYPAISILSAEWSVIQKPVVNAEPVSEEADDDDSSDENDSSDEDTQESGEEEKTEPVVQTKTTGNMTITLEIYMCNQ